MKWTSFARSFHTPTQAPWAPSFGYRNLVSSEPSLVYRGLLKSPIEFLALLLLVLRVLADNHNLALTADDLALLADRLNRRSYLHVILPPSNFDRSMRSILVGWDTGKPATTGARVTCAPPPALLPRSPRRKARIGGAKRSSIKSAALPWILFPDPAALGGVLRVSKTSFSGTCFCR